MDRKKLNFKAIYSKITKHGVLISDLAEEYGMSRAEFIDRLERGLDPKLFSKAIKEDERNQRRVAIKTRRETEMTTTMRQVEETQEKEPPYEVEKAIITTQNVTADSIEEKETTKEENEMEGTNTLEALTQKAEELRLQETKNQEALEKASQILKVREETFKQTQMLLEKAARAREKARGKLEQAKRVTERYQEIGTKLSTQREEIESKILEARNSAIYLVAPGYSGPKPEYGTFLSITLVNGFEVSIANPGADFVIEPQLKDMVATGIDSIKEYGQALAFTSLCLEYAMKDIPYTILVEDERVKKLLEIHLGTIG